MHGLDVEASELGMNDHHEELAARWLSTRFGSNVVDPVRLRVAAKRYLCAMETKYRASLSLPSLLILRACYALEG
jgi:predicted HD phosphohydrolase